MTGRVLGIDPNNQRFWSKVRGGDYMTCWDWTAYADQNGYGRFSVGGRAGGMVSAHRLAYELLISAIPDGLHLDHLCRNRRCVNPWHLEPVTVLVNSRRGIAGLVNGARQKAIESCPAGHGYDAANTRYLKNGARRCMACDRDAHRARYLSNPDQARLRSRAYRARKSAA